MKQNKEIHEGLKECLLDPTKDYRRELKHWKVDKDGNLVWLTDKQGNDKSYYVITKDELNDEDWLSHMKGKFDNEMFGEFVCAYFKACEMAGIYELKVSIFNFNDTCKFADEE